MMKEKMYTDRCLTGGGEGDAPEGAAATDESG